MLQGKAVLGDDFSLGLMAGDNDADESNVFDKGESSASRAVCISVRPRDLRCNDVDS